MNQPSASTKKRNINAQAADWNLFIYFLLPPSTPLISTSSPPECHLLFLFFLLLLNLFSYTSQLFSFCNHFYLIHLLRNVFSFFFPLSFFSYKLNSHSKRRTNQKDQVSKCKGIYSPAQFCGFRTFSDSSSGTMSVISEITLPLWSCLFLLRSLHFYLSFQLGLVFGNPQLPHILKQTFLQRIRGACHMLVSLNLHCGKSQKVSVSVSPNGDPHIIRRSEGSTWIATGRAEDSQKSVVQPH